MAKECPKCGETNNDGRYFCKKCGTLLDKSMFSDASVYSKEQFKIMRILENLKLTPHSKIIWNDTIDLYTKKVEKIRALTDIPEIKSENDIIEKMDNFLSLCTKPDFQIAFVGTIKTGKSTLINSLLGHNYASMDVTPETAALTKFRSSPTDYIDVTFYSHEEWEKLWASISSGADAFMKEYKKLKAEQCKEKWIDHEPIHEELANIDVKDRLSIWSSSKRAEHYFVKEIEVGISSLSKDFPKEVLFVDTPGLSDPVAYRSEITRQYIRKANAVFVCVEAKKLQKEEIETIATVFASSSDKKSKVHIIATHWDNLNDPVEDWKRQKVWLEETLVGKGFFDNVEMARTNILYSSAYIYNLCRESSTLKDIALISFAVKMKIMNVAQFFSLKKYLPEIQKATNIPEIMKIVNEKLAKNYKTLLFKEIEQRYDEIKQKLETKTEERKNETKSIIETSYADIKAMRDKVDEIKKRYDEISAAGAQLKVALNSVEKATQKRLDKILPRLK